MTEKQSAPAGARLDSKIQSDWEAVLERLAEIESRSGGDSRRRAIMARVRWRKHAS